MTRTENFKYFFMLLWIYLLFLIVPIYITANIMERPDIANLIFSIWNLGFIPTLIIIFINLLSAGWGLRIERKLQKPITNHIEQHGSCTYDELITHFMPVRIHLGISNALEHLLHSHQLVLENDCYRLPTQEEHKQWLEEDL